MTARCPATYRLDARPRLPALEAARIAGRPTPHTDWRCVREPEHNDPGNSPDHFALPLGVRGPTFRFDATMAEPITIAPIVHAFLPGDDPAHCGRTLPNMRTCAGTPQDHADVVDQALAHHITAAMYDALVEQAMIASEAASRVTGILVADHIVRAVRGTTGD